MTIWRFLCYTFPTSAHASRQTRQSGSQLWVNEQQEPLLATSREPVPREVRIVDFPVYVHFLLKDSELEVQRQFEEIRDECVRREKASYTLHAGMANCNRAKNRYHPEIVPYDHTRVTLESSSAPDGYINASYVRGLDHVREYIASQGPLPETVNDHWRMIYEHKVALIVQLTQCQEGPKKKSEPYWPSEVGRTEDFNEIQVTLESESALGASTVRKMLVTCTTDRSQTEPLQVVQLHYLGWQDLGVPSEEELADFLSTMGWYASQAKSSGCGPPILVHCSAGVGRSGTLLALDILIRSLDRHKCSTINVYHAVMELRSCRTSMVETKSQLAFVYRVLLRHLEKSGYLPDTSAGTH